VGGSGQRHEPVEQLVLGGLEAGQGLEHLLTVALHRIGMALSVVVLPVRHRGLGHERSQAGLVGELGQVRELLIGDVQLLAEPPQPIGHLTEASLDLRPGHARIVVWDGAGATLRCAGAPLPPLRRVAAPGTGSDVRRLLLLAFIWGWSFLFIKVAVEGMTPATVAFARIALGATVLHVVLRTQGDALPLDRTSWRRFVVVAAWGSALPFTMLAWGEERISSALTAVLNASTPIFTALAAAVLLQERLRPAHVVGLAVGFVGVGVASGVGGSDFDGASFGGSAASVAAGACYGIAFAYARRHLMGIPPVVAACGQLTAGAIMMAPFAVATSVGSGVALTPTRTASIVVLGAVGTGVAYVLNYSIVREVGATRASLVTYLIPAVAVAVGVVVLDEPFHLTLVLGAVLIVAGIMVVNDRYPWSRLPRPPAAVASVAILVALAAGLVGCGTGAADEACGPVQREALDSSYLVHVLPGSEPAEYASDPPTSGPHQPSPPIAGVSDEPLSRPVQVGILERGDVLLQHRPDVPEDHVADLAALAGDGVVVAPNPDLDEPVVATAWVHRQSCDEVDAEILRAFIDDHAGRGPGADG
jgi:drug/metabolite transporter (DMT)-like permease